MQLSLILPLIRFYFAAATHRQAQNGDTGGMEVNLLEDGIDDTKVSDASEERCSMTNGE
jgi:hypothetical protein